MLFSKFINNRNKKQSIMNKAIYLGQSVVEISEIIMYEFLYDYLKPKYTEEKQSYVTWI